jgi:putative transposase
MPRRPRLSLPGVPWHIIQRGNNRAVCFHAGEGYRALFKAHLDPEVIARIRSATNGNVVLGSKRFEEQIAKMLTRRVTRGKAGRPKRSSNQTAQQTPI